MNLLLDNSILAWGLIFVAVPLLLHLYARSRPPAYQFSSLRMLEQVMKKQSRIKKPQNLLLLIIRTLIFLCLIGAFLLPKLMTSFRQDSSSTRNITILIDASASMNSQEGGRSRFADACAKAADIITGLRTKDRADVIWLKSTPQSVLGSPGLNHKMLVNKIRQQKCSSEQALIKPAFNLAISKLQEKEGEKEIIVISDFQQTNWTNFIPEVPESVKVIMMKTGNQTIGNLACTSVKVSPAAPIAGDTVNLLCTVNNYSTTERNTEVFLKAGEIRESRQVFLKPGAETTLLFKLKELKKGTLPVSVSISEDEFSLDNSNYKIINVAPKLIVDIVGTQSSQSRYWKNVTSVLPWCRATLQPGFSAETKADLLIVTSPWLISKDQLKTLLETGKGVIIATQAPDYLKEIAPLFTEKPLLKSTKYIRSRFPYQLAPLFKESIPVEKALFFARHEIKAGAISPENIKLSFHDKMPALFCGSKHKNLIFWNLAVDRKSSNWSSCIAAVPVSGNLIRQFTNASKHSVNFQTGHVMIAEGNGVTQSFHNETGEKVDAKEILINDRKNLKVQFTQPGIYYRLSSENRDYVAVNLPREESDLTTAAPKVLEKIGEQVRESGDIRYIHSGLQLWPYLILLGAILFCSEIMLLAHLEKK